MRTMSRRSLALALLFICLSSGIALALPGFSDQNVAEGNLNPTDRIAIQQVKITGDSGSDVSITSATVQNLGTAVSGDITKIEFWDGGTKLGETTNINGLASGITVNFNPSYSVPKGQTRYVKVIVTIGTAAAGEETIALRLRFHYTRGTSTYTSPWIADLSTETIRKGGFDQTSDTPPDAGFLNPDDQAVVHTSVFNDNDANGNDILWTGTGTTTIVRVENLGTATTADIDQVKVTLRIGGTDYVRDWMTWAPASPMSFSYNQFAPALPIIPNNSSVTVIVEMEMHGAGAVTDGRTIQIKVTLLVKEGTLGSEPAYEQSVTSGTAQTLRKQGFETTTDESTTVSSGAKATGESLEQIVKVTDADINTKNIRIVGIQIRNIGTATGAEIHRIQVIANDTTLMDVSRPSGAAILDNFKTGITVDLTGGGYATHLVADNGVATIKIYYYIGTPVDGHTVRPVVQIQGQEADGGTKYWSDEATYPDPISLFSPGFETIENVTPPEGGTAYSGQRLLVQIIQVIDRDENTYYVLIHPIVVKNIGTAQGNPDVTKVQIYRRNTPDGEEVLLGETTDLSGFRTGGARIEITANNQVADAAPQAEAYLYVYLTIAEPEVMVAGRTVQLETRVLHTENQVGYDKMVTSNQWILEVNNRPVPNFSFAKVTTAAAAVGPKADFTYEDTIQFTGTATDPDGDAISSWLWDFGDGNTSSAQNPTHQYPNGGTFGVTLTVTDARGVTGSVTKTIEVEAPPNELPTIDELTADPENPAVDQDVQFGATVTDPDQAAGTAFGYEWDFGDETTSTAASPTHSYDEAGVYTVTLTVTDARGATDTATIDVIVGNEPPTLTGVTAAPATGAGTGDEVTFTATGYADPDDDSVDHYEWDFNDGETVNSDGQTVTHIFAAPGTYTVSVVAVDERGARSAARTVDVTVTGPARTVLFAFPNPAATVATFTYFLPTGATGPILRIYSLIGELVVEEELPAGGTTFDWDLRTAGGTALPNGLYFCVVTVTGANPSEVFRLLIVR